MLAYASPDDLTKWTTPVPDDDERFIRSASLLVAHATRTARYEVDGDGLPTMPAIRDAMRDATCSQVATWRALGIDPAKAGVSTESAIASKSRGPSSISYDTAGVSSVTAMEKRARLTSSLTIEALSILETAGLLNSVIEARG